MRPSIRRNKFSAVRTEVDGRKFASKAEAARYVMLRDQELRGEIFELACQVPFKVFIKTKLATTYLADFTYYRPACKGGSCSWVVEDVKGFRTEVYRLKKKLVEAYYGIAITEIRMGKHGPITPKP